MAENSIFKENIENESLLDEQRKTKSCNNSDNHSKRNIKKNEGKHEGGVSRNSGTSRNSSINVETTEHEKKLNYAEKLCAFYVKKPKLAFAIALSLQLSFLLANGALYLMQYDIFPYDFTQVPLNLEKDATKLRTDAFKFVNEDSRVNLLPTTAIPTDERTLKASPLELVYKVKKGENILTPKNLKIIRDLEEELYRAPLYQKVCHLYDKTNETKECSLPLSVIRLFDGSFSKELYDPDFQSIPTIFHSAMNISQTRPLISFVLDKNSHIGQHHVRSQHLRSVLFNGLPLKGYKHGEDRKAKQLEHLKINVVKAFGKLLSEKYESGIGDVSIYYMNMDLFFNAVESQVVWDLLLAGGSLVFIFSFIWFQTGSLWITGWAVFGIITNFFGANLVYRIVLDFRFIGIFHVLSVFMILGIGADDIFVFFNTWKLMEAKNFSNLTQHLTETFRVAAGAMFVTSLTTAAAFLASAASPLLGVSSFGVFSGILVIVNYISVCIYFPSVVITYHYFWKDYIPFQCCRKDNNKNIDRKLMALENSQEAERNVAPPQDEMSKLFKAVVKWFETTYANRIVLHPKIKWIILFLFGSLSIVFFVYAMHLGPDEEQIQVWPKGTNWYDMRQLKLRAFQETGEGTDVIRIYTVWGLKLQDRTSCHFTDFRCKGKTVFDEDFDLNKPGCQEAVLGFCKRLKSLSRKKAEKMKIRRSVATGELEVSCFIDEMDKYFKSDYINMLQSKTKYGKNFQQQNISFGIPMDATKTRALMDLIPEVYNTSVLGKDYHRYFETALGFWLSGGGNPGQKFDYYKYSSYMGGSLDDSVDPKNGMDNIARAQGGRYGNRLRYVAVVVNTTLTGSTLKYSEGIEASNNWEEFLEEEIKEMPASCNKPFQCTPEWNEWHWLRVQGELLKGARIGIVIGLTLAFPVLVFTTYNWVIGILATLTIALITICVVGLIPLVGWNLGVMESINLTLVVGLAVDYAVHLADAYVRCESSDRKERVRFMLGHVGVSVLAGAATTLGASAFMLGSKILFFFQFGIFIFCTIAFSIVYALIVFTVIIGIIGPEGDKGSLLSIRDFFKRRTSDGNSRAELMMQAESRSTLSKEDSMTSKDTLQNENDNEELTGTERNETDAV